MDPEVSCSSLEAFDAVFVGFTSRVAASLRRDFEGDFPSSDGITLTEIKKFSVPLSDPNNQWFWPRCKLWRAWSHYGDLGSGPRFGGRAPGQRLLGIAVLMSWFFSVLVLIGPCRASKRFKVWPMLWMTTRGEFDFSEWSAPNAEVIKMRNSRLKTRA